MYLPGRTKASCKGDSVDYYKGIPLVLEFGGLVTRAGN